MIELTNRIININDVEELILNKPKTRDGLIKVTQAGDLHYATEITLEEFERLTGKYIKGLEPAPSSQLTVDEEIERLVEKATDMGYRVSVNKENSEVVGAVEFTTDKNIKFISYFNLKHRNDEYHFRASKGKGMRTNASMSSTSKYIENAVDNILLKAKEYTSTMVQNLTLGQEEMKKKGDNTERALSSDGVDVLFPDETLSDYFKKQDMPAGVVVNSAGRYQTFHSYLTYEKKMVLHHDVKSYANKKNAEKNLNKLGFSIDGKQLDNLNRQEMKENLSESMSRSLSCSYGEDNIGHFQKDQASLTFSNILMREDEKFGCCYYIDVEIQDRVSGCSKVEEVPIDAREGGNTYSVQIAITNMARDLVKQFESGELEFDSDNRTFSEKQKHHLEQISNHKKNISHYEARFEETDDQRFKDSLTERIAFEKSMLEKHIDLEKTFIIDDSEFSL